MWKGNSEQFYSITNLQYAHAFQQLNEKIYTWLVSYLKRTSDGKPNKKENKALSLISSDNFLFQRLFKTI